MMGAERQFLQYRERGRRKDMRTCVDIEPYGYEWPGYDRQNRYAYTF